MESAHLHSEIARHAHASADPRREPSGSTVERRAGGALQGEDQAAPQPERAGAAPRPWYAATMAVACSDCGAEAGVPCFRDRFHVSRYEHARELAGVPIQRTKPLRDTVRGERAARARRKAAPG